MKYIISEQEYQYLLNKFSPEVSREERRKNAFVEKRALFFTDTVLCLLCVSGINTQFGNRELRFWIEMETCGLTTPQ